MQYIKDLKNMLLGSQIYEKANRFNDSRSGAKHLAVGDCVFYIPETSKYGIRKSRIKEMHVEKSRWPLAVDRCNLSLENGVTVDYNDTFNSMRDAQEYIIAKLKQTIDYRKREVASLLKEIKFEERLQKLFEEKLNSITESN